MINSLFHFICVFSLSLISSFLFLFSSSAAMPHQTHHDQLCTKGEREGGREGSHISTGVHVISITLPSIPPPPPSLHSSLLISKNPSILPPSQACCSNGMKQACLGGRLMSRQAWVASEYLVGPGSESFVRGERSLVRKFCKQHESVSRNRVRAGRFDIASIEPHTRTSTDVCATCTKKDSLCTTATSDTTTDEPTH